MPEENARGMLIGPMGSPAESLDGNEHKYLASCLRILQGWRDEPRGRVFYDALRNLIHIYVTSRTLSSLSADTTKGVLAGQIGWWLAEYESSVESRNEDFYGVLHERHGGTHTLTESEQETLSYTLAVIRLGGWFPKWLDLRVHAISNNKLPGDRYPSPLDVAGSLTLEIAKWQDTAETSKAFAEMRPDLLFPPPPVEPEAVAEPATTGKRAKAPRARKRHRAA